MIRRILVALDDTPGAQAAADEAIRLARMTGAALGAALVLDLPHTSELNEAVPPGGLAFLEHRNERLRRLVLEEAEGALTDFAARVGDMPFDVLRLPEAPEQALLRASALYDLVVIGRDVTLGREEVDDDALAPVISALLQHGAKPLLVVPPEAQPRPMGSILIGYDGSVPAQRALSSFALLGLAGETPVQVLSIASKKEDASALAAEAVSFLASHDITAEPIALEGERPIDLLLAEVEAIKPRFMVAGAYEENGLLALLLGSGTRKLLAEVTCPVFIQH
ncbi:universal stress protein [Acetobacteraceae bacterium H6797]|nr:universal stress protein [Acetobacteraceae bacterium H6797]